MSHKIIPVLLILITPFTVYSQQARFDEATFLLEQNEYREALNMYQSIADNGYSAGALWLNMGVAYTALDSLGMAKYYLLQAANYPETAAEADDALTYVNERLNRRSAVLPELPWDRFFGYLSDRVGTDGLFIAAFIVFYGAAAFIISSWFFSGKPAYFKITGISFLIISALIFTSAWYVQYLDERYGTGVVIDRQQTVFENPDTESVAVSTAYEGYKLKVDFNRSMNYEGWNYVRLENGMYGWIEGSSIKVF
jgi:tetratricopeptide (TPR) repeat protein